MENEIYIREAVDSDKEQLTAVSQDAHTSLRRVYRPRASAKQIGSDSTPYTRIVAIKDNLIVGMATYEVDGNSIYFGSLGVLNSHRRLGVTRRIIEYIEGIAFNLGFSKLTCATIEETGNVPIFEKLGFKVIHRCIPDKFEAINNASVHEVKMEKNIVNLTNIKAIFFDMGNTLIDFHQGPDDSFKDQKGLEAISSHMAEKFNITTNPEEVYDLFIKNWYAVFPQRKILRKEFSIDDFMNPLLKKLDLDLSTQEKIDLMIKFDSEYQRHLVTEYGLIETLAKLKSNFQIGVISNSPSYPEVNIDHFKYLKLADFIDSYTFSYNCKNGKPEKEIFLTAMGSLNVMPNESIMVGDSLEIDISPAKKLGLKTVWLNTKLKRNETNIVPDIEVKTLKNLCEKLNVRKININDE